MCNTTQPTHKIHDPFRTDTYTFIRQLQNQTATLHSFTLDALKCAGLHYDAKPNNTVLLHGHICFKDSISTRQSYYCHFYCKMSTTHTHTHTYTYSFIMPAVRFSDATRFSILRENIWFRITDKFHCWFASDRISAFGSVWTVNILCFKWIRAQHPLKKCQNLRKWPCRN